MKAISKSSPYSPIKRRESETAGQQPWYYLVGISTITAEKVDDGNIAGARKKTDSLGYLDPEDK